MAVSLVRKECGDVCRKRRCASKILFSNVRRGSDFLLSYRQPKESFLGGASFLPLEVAFLAIAIAGVNISPEIFITRRVSEGRMREDAASDACPSLAYASG